jgi:DNA-binding GntR family transcriptional regulator
MKHETRMPRIERAKLGSQVLAILKEEIANRRFQPGSRINVEDLAREIGVSRTPLWEAVHRLEQEGLLIRIPHRGVFMAELSHQQALDLYAVRQPLEAMAAGLAASKASERALVAMFEEIRAQREIVARRDIVAYSRSDFQFHDLVYTAAGNPFLQETLRRLRAQMRPLNLDIEPVLDSLHQDHVRLHSALQARCREQAERAFRDHNQRIIDLLRRRIAGGDELGTG